MSSSAIILDAQSVGKTYLANPTFVNLLYEYFGVKNSSRPNTVLNDVSFRLRKGASLGIIGLNGAGKSTLLKIISGNSIPSAGQIRVGGSLGSILELGASFQMELTAEENLNLYRQIVAASGDVIIESNSQILAFAELEKSASQRVGEFSSGMLARLAFAAASSMSPEILLLDEALSVGDLAFQQKCYERLDELRKSGTSIIMVSHDVTQVQQFCDNVLWLEEGNVKFYGETKTGCDLYLQSVWDKQIYQAADDPFINSEEHTGTEIKINSLNINGKAIGIGEELQLSYGTSLMAELDFTLDQMFSNASVSFYLKNRYGTLVLGGSTIIWDCAEECIRKNSVLIDFEWYLKVQPGEYTLNCFITGNKHNGEGILDGALNIDLVKILVSPGKHDIWSMVAVDRFLNK